MNRQEEKVSSRDKSSRICSRDSNIGGQAVIEGVMMRSPQCVTVAIRKNNGEILVKKELYVPLVKKYKYLNIPIVRGAIALIESLYLGMKALTFSADQAMEDELEEGKVEKKEKTRKEKVFMSLWLTLTLLLGVALALFIFFYLPLLLTDLLKIENRILFNLTSGVIRLGIFFVYIWAITFWKSMRRIFEYHGAEHKSIFALEAGEKLTAENAYKYSTHHPRCGTSFLLIVMVVSILIFMFLPRPHTISERLLRLAFVPLIAGISYELIKLSGKKRNSRLAAILIAPGLFLQKITTKEPDGEQLEVALTALRKCLE